MRQLTTSRRSSLVIDVLLVGEQKQCLLVSIFNFIVCAVKLIRG